MDLLPNDAETSQIGEVVVASSLLATTSLTSKPHCDAWSEGDPTYGGADDSDETDGTISRSMVPVERGALQLKLFSPAPVLFRSL